MKILRMLTYREVCGQHQSDYECTVDQRKIQTSQLIQTKTYTYPTLLNLSHSFLQILDVNSS